MSLYGRVVVWYHKQNSHMIITSFAYPVSSKAATLWQKSVFGWNNASSYYQTQSLTKDKSKQISMTNQVYIIYICLTKTLKQCCNIFVYFSYVWLCWGANLRTTLFIFTELRQISQQRIRKFRYQWVRMLHYSSRSFSVTLKLKTSLFSLIAFTESNCSSSTIWRKQSGEGISTE